MAARSRRNFLKKAAVAAPAAALAPQAKAQSGPERKVVSGGRLFSGCVTYGNLVFVAGKGAHFEGDIKAHTDHVLKEVEKELVKAGSSMQKVLKVNVYLNDLKDYQGMNEVFRGRFGDQAPVRTTIAAAGGIPGNSLVEIDCIAFI
jgi:enamine deaminase RidA (YjgF/YER057c/UK114 family)